jgi:hypothetical protein
MSHTLSRFVSPRSVWQTKLVCHKLTEATSVERVCQRVCSKNANVFTCYYGVYCLLIQTESLKRWSTALLQDLQLWLKEDAALDEDSKPAIDRFFFGLCPVSLKIGDDLKVCSGCRSIGYAGREEQKTDWKRHKAVCKVMQSMAGGKNTCYLTQSDKYKVRQM